MKNSTKLEKVKHFLDENGIKYEEREKRFGHSDIWLPSVRVAVKIEGDDDMEFFKTHKRTCHPVFIRDKESVSFVLEKLQNTIIRSMQAVQQRLMNKKEREEKK